MIFIFPSLGGDFLTVRVLKEIIPIYREEMQGYEESMTQACSTDLCRMDFSVTLPAGVGQKIGSDRPTTVHHSTHL